MSTVVHSPRRYVVTRLPLGKRVVSRGVPGPAGASGSAGTGKTVWVDSANGNDGTAVRGQFALPFLTLTAAQSAAQSGDTIRVRPGSTSEKGLLKDGVNWHLENGRTVAYTGSADGSVLDDSANGANAAVTAVVSGTGVFNNASTSATVSGPASFPNSAIRITNSGTDLTVDAEAAYSTFNGGTGNYTAVVSHQGGKGTFRFTKEVVGFGTSGNTAVSAYWWSNGESHISAPLIKGQYSGVYADPAITSSTDSAWVTADGIVGTDGLGVALFANAFQDCKLWVDAKYVYGGATAVLSQAGKLYLRAGKVESPAQSLSVASNAWLTIQKLTLGNAVSGISGGAFNSGFATVRIDHVESLVAVTVGLQVDANSLVTVGRYLMNAGSTTGVEMISGTKSTFSGNIDGSAATAGNPVKVSASGAVLRDCVLKAASGRYAITADSAVTLTVEGSLTIDASAGGLGVHPNVTIVGWVNVLGGTLFYPTPANGTVAIDSYAQFAYTIDRLNNLKTSAGTLTLKVQINGVDVTGLTGLSVTATPQTATATALNSVAVGDRVTVVISAVSSAANLEFTSKRTRT